MILNFRVQAALISYAIVSSVLMSGVTFFMNMSLEKRLLINGSLNLIEMAIYLLVELITLLTIILFGALITNRFAGPIWRLNKSICNIANGEVPESIHLRTNDLYKDLIDDHNRMVEYLKKRLNAPPPI